MRKVRVGDINLEVFRTRWFKAVGLDEIAQGELIDQKHRKARVLRHFNL